MNKKIIGFTIFIIILLALAIWILIDSYIHSGSYYCKKLELKKDSDIPNIDSNTVNLSSVSILYDDDTKYLYSYPNNSGKEIVNVISYFPIIKITKFNKNEIIIDLQEKKIYTIISGKVVTYSANIYKDKYNSLYIEALDEKNNVLSTVFGNNAKTLYIGDLVVCNNYISFR